MDFVKKLSQIANQVGDFITDEIRSSLELAEDLFKRKEFSAAIYELNKILQQRPEHAQALYFLGLCYDNRKEPGDENLATQSLKLSLEINPDFIKSYLALGQIYEKNQSLDKAEFYYRAALAHTRDSSILYELEYLLGRIYYSQGLYQKAILELQKGLSHRKEEPEGLGLLGLAFEKKVILSQGWEQEVARQNAVDFLERAVLKESVQQEVWLAYGTYLQRQKKWEQSEHIYRECLVRFPPNHASFLALAKLYQEQEKWKEAKEQAHQVLSFKDTDPVERVTAYQILAFSEEQLGAVEKALTAYENAFEENISRVFFSSVSERKENTPLIAWRKFLQEVLLFACRWDRISWGLALIDKIEVVRKEEAMRLAELIAFQSLRLDFSVETKRKLLQQALAEQEKELDPSPQISYLISIAWADFSKQTAGLKAALPWLEKAAHLLLKEPTAYQRLAKWSQEEYQQIFLDFPDFLARLEIFFTHHFPLLAFLPVLQKIKKLLSDPLVVAVAGEFNAGKSTFLNAWLGEEIFKAGITPTTSFIQKLVFSHHKRGTIFYQDGSKQEQTEQELATWIKGDISAQEKANQEGHVSWIEVGYPVENLKQVHWVDTPGFNSIDSDHEKRTREFLMDADVIIWIFSANQAGKHTEKEVLTWLWQQGKREIIGIVNKIDRLPLMLDRQTSSHPSLEETVNSILKYVQENEQEMGSYLKEILPFSGKDALFGKKYGDSLLIERSFLEKVNLALEKHFFSRALSIKQHKAIKKMLVLLNQASELIKLLKDKKEKEHQSLATTDFLKGLQEEEKLVKKIEEYIGAERRLFLQELKIGYQLLANEIVGCVKTGRWAIGENEVTSSDRDYILDKSQELFKKIISTSLIRMSEELRKEIYPLQAIHLASSDSYFHQITKSIYLAYQSFVQGYFAGGKIDEFCYQILPKMELKESGIIRILEQKFPATLEILEQQIFFPLRQLWKTLFLQKQNHQLLQKIRWELLVQKTCLEEPLCFFQDYLQLLQKTIA